MRSSCASTSFWLNRDPDLSILERLCRISDSLGILPEQQNTFWIRTLCGWAACPRDVIYPGLTTFLISGRLCTRFGIYYLDPRFSRGSRPAFGIYRLEPITCSLGREICHQSRLMINRRQTGEDLPSCYILQYAVIVVDVVVMVNT